MFSNASLKKKEEESIVFNYPISETIKLIKPPHLESINFWDVINNRTSKREFRELSLNEISKVLWLSAKVKDVFVQDNGYILTKRPSASAGARHPIDIIVQSPILDSSKSFYYYNPFQHDLNKLTFKNNFIEKFRIHLSSMFDIRKAAICWFVAHPNRTASKYDNSLSLIWRDAGALIHSVQLVCAGLRINSCAAGTFGEPFISEMFSEHGNVFGIGGILIG
ncbi:MAG: hypothetical protein ACTHOB_08640 [Ginsengibacter sp.]